MWLHYGGISTKMHPSIRTTLLIMYTMAGAVPDEDNTCMYIFFTPHDSEMKLEREPVNRARISLGL